MGWRHAHGRKDGWGRCWAVRGARGARVVLAATPRKTNARVADGISLHLVDGHFGGVTLDELDESTSFSWGNLHVGDFTEALEEGAKLIFGDISRQTTDENSGVVRVSELVHGLGSTVVPHWRSAHGIHATRTALLRHAVAHGLSAGTAALVLGGGGGNAHGAVTAVHALHFIERLLLILFACESHETVAARHARDGVRHDLGGLARRVLVLKQLHKDKLVDLGTKIAHEDGELGSALVAAMGFRN